MAVPSVPSANQFAYRSNAAAYNALVGQLTPLFNFAAFGIDPLDYGYITFTSNGSDNYSKSYSANGSVLGGIIVTGGGGDDVVGQGADDLIFSGSGDDEVDGRAGDDIVFADAGNDDVHGGLGNDRIYGESDSDEIDGDSGDDYLNGGAGSDELDGGTGNDHLVGSDGGDSLDGDEGEDLVEGGGGADDLNGDTGNDRLLGGAGDDQIDGDTGNDVLEGGRGNDDLHGGTGADSFTGHGGDDTIDDFDGGEGDKLVLTGVWSGDFTLTEDGDDVVLNFTNGDSITLVDVGDFDPLEDIEYGAFSRYLGTLDPSSLDINGNIFVGSGNTGHNYHVLQNHDADIELGLKIHYRQGNDILPNSFSPSDTAHYIVPDGTQVIDPAHGVGVANANRSAFSIDFSVNTGLDGSTNTLTDFTFRIIITSGDGESQIFTMQNVGPGNTPWTNQENTGGFTDDDGGANAQLSQNSFNFGFAFFQAAFGADALQAGETYHVELQAWDGSDYLGSVNDVLLLS
jgi:hypothetical protein